VISTASVSIPPVGVVCLPSWRKPKLVIAGAALRRDSRRHNTASFADQELSRRRLRKRNALAMTLTDESDMAAPAIMGLSKRPKNG
jgi:hypothetical protein